MGLRADVLDYLACGGDHADDDETVPDQHEEFVSRHGVASGVDPEVDLAGRDEFPALTDRGRLLVDRVRRLDTAPVGVTLCGPAYRDTPILYANRTFREFTGYSFEELRGRNPRLLQGPETNAGAVEDLREAVSIWAPVTVEVWNHRRDGTPFLNRVSLRPLPGDDGTITHWAAVQGAIEGPG